MAIITDVRYKLVRWDLSIVGLCYLCAFLLCFSPLIPYVFQSMTQLYAGTIILGTPLAALGLWLNHRAAATDQSPKA